MQSTTVLSDEKILKMIHEAVEQFFETMMGQPISFRESRIVEPEGDPAINETLGSNSSKVVAAVGFSGKANGVAYMYYTEKLSRNITCEFLGMTEDEVEDSHELVNDALGEVANMTIGAFKNKICDMGYECRLTIPSIVRGSEFSIEASQEVERRFLIFDTMNQTFLIDLILKQPEE